ncbi:MAG: GntR family transcriptional regulator [Pseudomonadota bacterium]
MLEVPRSLSDQIYEAIVDEICGGDLTPGTHLVQERLAERFGVSRQPVQHAMGRLKADGMVEEIGRRGLFVTRLDPTRMLEHYGIRAALDGWAARIGALRISGDPEIRDHVSSEGAALQEAATTAAAEGDVALLVKLDDRFHQLIYATSGNKLITETAEPHWRFLRRAMGDVLRHAETPTNIWGQHRGILDAMLAGDGDSARDLAEAHAKDASFLLLDALYAAQSGDAT